MMNEIQLEYLFSHGLTESTEDDLLCYDACMGQSIPFTAHWENLDDGMKVLQWDSEWEKYIKHRAELIDREGRESYLPWNLYKTLGVGAYWLDGYNYTQQLGDCGGNSLKNAIKASNFTNARRTGRQPREVALSVAYGIARGNGKMNHGSGCNLNPLAKWSATVGNYWTSDFGKYDGGKYISKYKKGSEQDKNALRTQTIPVFLPSPSFDYCYAVCEAGFGIVIGSHVYPIGSAVNSDGLAQASLWKAGAHAIALIAAWKSKTGKRYIFLENSHGQKYTADSLSSGVKQWGCWVDENDLRKMATEKYGRWFTALCEMGI